MLLLRQPSLISFNIPIDSGSIIKPCTLKPLQVRILASGLLRDMPLTKFRWPRKWSRPWDDRVYSRHIMRKSFVFARKSVDTWKNVAAWYSHCHMKRVSKTNTNSQWWQGRLNSQNYNRVGIKTKTYTTIHQSLIALQRLQFGIYFQITFRINNVLQIISSRQWHIRKLQSFGVHAKGLFILQSNQQNCWCPGEARG